LTRLVERTERRPIEALPSDLVGRIAAGEVVERPSSVVKELVENALDAGARRVSVEMSGGLTGLLRVADDGDGIPASELPLAVHRHATSKIREPEDLDRIESLGFRGEGLAAIGAVSRLALVSRSAGAESGARVTVEGGAVSAVLPAARAPGTTVEVRDLFYNTPARRKFLRSLSAELRQISQLLQSYALSRPHVHFSLGVEGRVSLEFPSVEDFPARARQVLGADRLSRMIPILIEEPDLALEGFLGAPEDSRIRSGHQIFLLNGRWVGSPLLRTATREAYGDLIPPSRHPEAVLQLHLPPKDVDVNVHPTKREVRLVRERELYPRLIGLLRKKVEDRFPSLRLRPDAGAPGETTRRPTSYHPVGAGAFGNARVAEGESSDLLPGILPFPGLPVTGTEPAAEDEAAPAMASMWQAHSTYIFASILGAVLIIDQHAAHERVLYEQALARLRGEKAVSQELLFPQVVELTHDEVSILLEVSATLEKLGFHLELFGGTSVLVHAIPAGLRAWRHGALLRDVLDHYTELPTALDVQERVAQSVACHGAVKAGQKLSLEEMNTLVDQLFATEKPQGDPHGRPVFLRVELGELHRRFGRSG
jgi:DNA mismatch repair protein MutL